MGENCIMRSFITCSLPQIFGHVAHTGENRNSYSVLVGKLEEKTPHARGRIILK
jgi:hypothetical protein